MATMGIDGLVSGLETTSIINRLMQVEAMPQTMLKSRQTATTSLVAALQALNTKVASLAQTATKATTADAWSALKASSSASSVTATTTTATGATQAGSLTFAVDRLATRQVSLTAPSATVADLVVNGAVTVRAADGTLTEVAVDPAASFSDVARALNGAGAGVSATVVTVGGVERLQLSSTGTGEAAAFTLVPGTAADAQAGAPALGLGTVTAAQDAQVTLWPGSGIVDANGDPVTVTSATNTFADVLPGVSFTVSAVEAAPVTLTVERDDKALSTLASNLVSAIGVVLSEIASRTAPTTTTRDDGTTTVAGGLLSGDSAVRGLQQGLQSAASFPVDGVSPAEVGIVLGRDGTFTFDADAFASALAADPARVQKIVSGLAQRVADVATGASDATTGSLTLRVSGQQTFLKDLGAQIDSWDTRLALRRESLQRTYAALEVALSSMQSQSSWLANQLASLTSSSSS